MFSITYFGWVLFLHLLSAFALVGGLTLFVVAQVAARRTGLPAVAVALGRIVRVGTTGVRAGLIGTVVFGVWLVLIVNGLSILDGWILATVALWLVAGALGDRSVVLFRRATRLASDLVSQGRGWVQRRARHGVSARLAPRPSYRRAGLSRRDPCADGLEAGRMSVFATIRPGNLDLPLFLHVLGAMTLVGAATAGLLAALVTRPPQILAWARGMAFRTFLIAALPAFVLMRVGAEWMRIREFGDSGADPGWLFVGYTAADGGGVLLIACIVLSWLAVRRGSPGLAKAAAIVMGIAIAGWIIAIWAMSAKPV